MVDVVQPFDQVIEASQDEGSVEVVQIRDTETVALLDPAIEFVETEMVEMVQTVVPETEMFSLGVQGPPGVSGSIEDLPVFTKRTDVIDDTLLYTGQAAPGALESAAVWRISRIAIAADDDVTEVFAGGTDTFDKVWDDRLSLAYS